MDLGRVEGREGGMSPARSIQGMLARTLAKIRDDQAYFLAVYDQGVQDGEEFPNYLHEAAREFRTVQERRRVA